MTAPTVTNERRDTTRAEEPARNVRVMLLLDALQVNGPSRLVVALATSLRDRGMDVRVAYLGLGDWPEGAETLQARRIPVLDLGLRSLLDPRPCLRLAAYLRREAVHVLHTHNRYAHLVGRPAAAIARCALVSTDHWIVETDLGVRGWIRRRLDDMSMQAFRGEMVMVSHAQHAEHARRGRLRSSHTEIVHNGVDPDAFHPDADARHRVRARLGIDDATPLLISVAVLRPGKGHEHLLEAMRRLHDRVPRARLVIVGDGSERARLQRLASALALNSVVDFLGTRVDVAELLAAADAYVHPSLFESYPTSVMEAMATALPVVATAVGGVPELIRHDETGVLVPPGDPDALASAVEHVLRPAVAARLGAAARSWVETHASHDAWVERHRTLYRRAIAMSANR